MTLFFYINTGQIALPVALAVELNYKFFSSCSMASSSQAYKSVQIEKFAQSVTKISPENQYWDSFRAKYEDKMHSSVAFVRFAAKEPYDCVVCSNLDVRLFRSGTFQSHKKLGFKKNPLTADIRSDNKLVAVGGKKGLLRIYSNASPSRLESVRALKGHFGDVHDVRFDPLDTTRTVSFSSDKTCRYWDIVKPSSIHVIRGHSDFVRCGDWVKHHESQACIISGSYDHKCKLWDLRDIRRLDGTVDEASAVAHDYNVAFADADIVHKCAMQFNHGLPVESCLSIPNSDLVAVAGGPKVTIWSLRKPNAPLASITLHRKTVTCLTTNKSGSRLLTGCLDNFVRMFTTSITGDSIFKNSHSMSVSAPVLALDMCSNDMMIAVGTAQNGVMMRTRDGHDKSLERYIQRQQYQDDPIAKYDRDMQLWMKQQQKLKFMTTEQATGKEKYIQKGTKDWVLRGQNLKLPTNLQKKDIGMQPQTQQFQLEDVTAMTMMVRFKSKKRMKQYDLCLKQFRYSDALDFALKAQRTEIVHCVLEDLWRRNGLEIALGGRDSQRLAPILEYLIYALPHPHLSQTALHVSAIVIDQYASIVGLTDDIDLLFKTMFEVITDAIMKYKILLKLQGSIDMILSAQDISANPLPPKMIQLTEKIEAMMQKTKAKFENSNKMETDY